MNVDLTFTEKVNEFEKIDRIGEESHLMSSVSFIWELEEKYFYPNVVMKTIPGSPSIRRNLIGLRLYKKKSAANNRKDRYVQSYVYDDYGASKYIQRPFKQILTYKSVFNNGTACTPLAALTLLKQSYSGIAFTNSVYDSTKEEFILNIEYGDLQETIDEFSQSYLIEDKMCCINENNEVVVYTRYFIDTVEHSNIDLQYVDSYPDPLYITTGDVYIAGNNFLVYPVLVSNNHNQIMINNNHVYRTVLRDYTDVLEDMLDDVVNFPSAYTIMPDGSSEESSEESSSSASEPVTTTEDLCVRVGVKGDEFLNKRTFLILKKTFQCGGIYENESSFSFVTYYSLADISAEYYLAMDYWKTYTKDYSGTIKKYYNADGTITVSGGVYKQEPIQALYKTTKANALTYMRNSGYNTSATCPPSQLVIKPISTSGYYQRYLIYPVAGKGNGVMSYDGYLIANGTADDYLEVTLNGTVVYSDSDKSVVGYNNKTLCQFHKGDVLNVYLADNAAGVCYYTGTLSLKPIVS